MGTPRITLEIVRHVAELARLALDEDEREVMRTQLSAVLEHMAELDAVDVEGIEPTVHAVPLVAPLRTDVVAPSLGREEALAGAPRSAAGAFAVPRVLDGDG